MHWSSILQGVFDRIKVETRETNVREDEEELITSVDCWEEKFERDLKRVGPTTFVFFFIKWEETN